MGGSCSRYCRSVVLPATNSFDSIHDSTTTSIVSKSTRIIENCIIIWLVDDPSNKYENAKRYLSHRFYGFQIFSNPDVCIDYIRSTQDEKIFLVTSVTYQSFQYMCDLPQLEKIYIFDSFSQHSGKQICQNNIFRDINHLAKQLQNDIELCELDLIDFSVISNSSHYNNSSMSLTKEQASFIFIQLIKEIQARLKYESTAKDVLIDSCRQFYMNNPEIYHTVDEFAKHYRPNLALDWLIKSCFISKILTRINRTHEIDIIYKFGFFIKHVNTQLVHLHEENKLFRKNISIVYRGKTMLNQDFDISINNNCNGLLSFSNFLITSTNKDDVLDFVHSRLAIHPDKIGIVFEIHIDDGIFDEQSPFALLRSHSSKNDRVCFSAGTVFRIVSVKQFVHNSLIMWLVRLKLIMNDDPELENLLKPFRTNELHDNPLFCLGKLLMDMGEDRRAEQSFLEMLNDKCILSQPRRLVRTRNGLAANYMQIGDYSTALEHYEQALQVSLTYLSVGHYELAPIYKNIGDCYFHLNDYHHASENYEKAIVLLESSKKPIKSSTINELWNQVKQRQLLIEQRK